MSRAKALYGDPCNRCGLCCQLGPCGAAVAILRIETGPCPALAPDGAGGGFVCGLGERLAAQTSSREDAEAVREAMAVATGAGIGCDMRFDAVDQVAAYHARPRMRAAAIRARRAASPLADAFLRAWRLAPPR